MDDIDRNQCCVLTDADGFLRVGLSESGFNIREK